LDKKFFANISESGLKSSFQNSAETDTALKRPGGRRS